VISEDRKRMGGQAPRRTRETPVGMTRPRSCHVGNHEKKARDAVKVWRAPLQTKPRARAPARTGLGLHLNDFQDLAENVFSSMGPPSHHSTPPMLLDGGDGIDAATGAQA